MPWHSPPALRVYTLTFDIRRISGHWADTTQRAAPPNKAYADGRSRVSPQEQFGKQRLSTARLPEPPTAPRKSARSSHTCAEKKPRGKGKEHFYKSKANRRPRSFLFVFANSITDEKPSRKLV